MKNLLFILSLFIQTVVFSQTITQTEYEKLITQTKEGVKIDKNDKTVLNLLSDFYAEALQSDKGELNQDIPKRIEKLYADKNAKNLHILNMFFAYQDHISQTAAVGKNPDANFQVKLMADLEREIQSLYGVVPVIIKIYKAESLSSSGQTKEAAEVVSTSLLEFPNSIPLKVYKYLGTKDEKIRKDLVENHPNHWMVQQFGIK